MTLMEIPSTIEAASIGIPDTLLLMLLALVVFGPRRLPEIGRQIGKLMYEFRKVSNDFKYQMEEELRASEEADRLKKLPAITSSGPTSHVPPEPPSFLTSAETTPILELTTETSGGEVTAGSVDSIYPETAPFSSPVAIVENPPEESRSQPRRFPQIQPPSTGELVAASKPFRGREPIEPAEPAVLTQVESFESTQENHGETAPGSEQDPHHA